MEKIIRLLGCVPVCTALLFVTGCTAQVESIETMAVAEKFANCKGCGKNLSGEYDAITAYAAEFDEAEQTMLRNRLDETQLCSRCFLPTIKDH